jgi:phage head maturation protease
MEPFNREFTAPASGPGADTLIAFGSEMKVLEETADYWRVGGWAVVFGSHDVSHLKDRFEKATDYDFEDGARRSLFYNHGLDGTIKKTRLGEVQLQMKDAGVWYEGQLKKRTDYLKAHAERIAQGIKSGLFGTSTGAPAHLVDREKTGGGHQVKMWPIAEVSITPTPAEPLTTCVSLKSLQQMEW